MTYKYKFRSISKKLFGNNFSEKLQNSNIQFNFSKPFMVVRNDGRLIRQFDNFYDASVFAIKLNTSYKKNGIKAISKVITLSP